MRALLVEDDRAIAADLAWALTGSGFVVDHAYDGERAWYLGNVEDYDLAVLDLGLPVLDGLSILRRWREADRAFPVLIVSARSDWKEKVAGIEAGADDYLGKPFEIGELVARARGLVRRAAGRVSSTVRSGGMLLDTVRNVVSIDGVVLRLSPLEFRLLDHLAHNLGRPVSAGELAEHLYGLRDDADTNAIEALIARLRRKLGRPVIETRRGFGYLLVEE